LGKLTGVVLFDILIKRGVKLLDILVFFSVLYRLRKLSKLVHWFLDSLKKTFGPVQRTCDWRQVVGDRSLLILFVDQELTFNEDGAHNLEVLLVQIQESDMFSFEFILNDGSAEETFE